MASEILLKKMAQIYELSLAAQCRLKPRTNVSRRASHMQASFKREQQGAACRAKTLRLFLLDFPEPFENTGTCREQQRAKDRWLSGPAVKSTWQAVCGPLWFVHHPAHCEGGKQHWKSQQTFWTIYGARLRVPILVWGPLCNDGKGRTKKRFFQSLDATAGINSTHHSHFITISWEHFCLPATVGNIITLHFHRVCVVWFV